MTKLLIASVILSTQGAFAAQVELCSQRLQQAAQFCGEGSSASVILKDYGQVDKCADAQSPDGRRQLVGTFTEEHAVVTLDAAAASLCTASFAILPSPVEEAKVMAGRVIMRGADQRLYVVSRTGEVSELLNSSLKSLKVQDFKIEGDQLVVQTDSGSFSWDEATILNKLNNGSRKARLIGLGRN